MTTPHTPEVPPQARAALDTFVEKATQAPLELTPEQVQEVNTRLGVLVTTIGKDGLRHLHEKIGRARQTLQTQPGTAAPVLREIDNLEKALRKQGVHEDMRPGFDATMEPGIAKDAVALGEKGMQRGYDAFKEWEGYTAKEPVKGTLIGIGGIGIGIAAIGTGLYGVYRMGKWVVRKLANGVKAVWNSSIGKLLLIGGGLFGAYSYGKKQGTAVEQLPR